jgi:hypothetical protein
MERVTLYMIFVAVWVIAAAVAVSFQNLFESVAGAFHITIAEAVAIFLIVMFVLTMLFLALIGREAGRSVARYLAP